MRAIVSAAVLAGALILPGCGIKGPLYLPEIPPAPAKAAPANGADHNKAAPSPAETR